MIVMPASLGHAGWAPPASTCAAELLAGTWSSLGTAAVPASSGATGKVAWSVAVATLAVTVVRGWRSPLASPVPSCGTVLPTLDTTGAVVATTEPACRRRP